jgi:glutathione S-transferase
MRGPCIRVSCHLYIVILRGGKTQKGSTGYFGMNESLGIWAEQMPESFLSCTHSCNLVIQHACTYQPTIKTTMPDSNITLYFLNSSRAIRVAWLLEELGLPYEAICADRAPNGLAPAEFKSQIPNALGKSPTIKDGSLVVTESGAILEYLCETYDKESKYLPNDSGTRAEVRQWLHAAEGTFMTHALAILYARWQIPEEGRGMLEGMEERLSRNVKNDLGWLEGALKEQGVKGRRWIVGDGITIADIQMQFRYVRPSLRPQSLLDIPRRIQRR